MKKQLLRNAIKLHAMWLSNEAGGERIRASDVSSFADLSNESLSHGMLMGANLRYAKMRRATFVQASLHNANMEYGDLVRANLNGAWMRCANLDECDLTEASLVNTCLEGADMRSAKLWGADLRYANLRRSNLSNANLLCADLRDADLRGAKIDGALVHKDAIKWAFVDKTALRKAVLIECSKETQKKEA